MIIQEYLKPTEAARLLGMSRGSLANLRWQNKGPVYLKHGRIIRYAMADLRAFMAKHRVEPELAA